MTSRGAMGSPRAVKLGQDMELTLFLATLNEAGNLKVLIPELKRRFEAEGTSFEILLVDASSDDGGPEVARELGCRVLTQSGPGYAQAVRDGFSAAQGDYVLMMDADGSHAPSDAVPLFRNRHRADIVINSRYVKGGGTQTGGFRDTLSRCLNLVYRRMLGLPFRELSGAFRIYRREVLERLRLESRFYEVQEEILAKAHWMGYSVVEIPYVYRPRAEGVSKARLLQYGIYLMGAALRLRRQKRSFAKTLAN